MTDPVADETAHPLQRVFDRPDLWKKVLVRKVPDRYPWWVLIPVPVPDSSPLWIMYRFPTHAAALASAVSRADKRAERQAGVDD